MDKFILIFFGAGLLVGCRGDTKVPIDYTIEDYYPLAVGNEWTYQCIRHSANPHRIYSEWTDTSLYIVKIKESYEWQGKEVFIGEWIKLSDSTIWKKDYAMYWDDEVAIVYLNPPEESEDTVTLEEDTKIAFGKKYTIPLWEPLVEENAWRGHRITCVDTTMRVAGKIFSHCIKIWYSPGGDFGVSMPSYPIFFAPGVGKIKWIPYENERGYEVWELVDYKIEQK